MRYLIDSFSVLTDLPRCLLFCSHASANSYMDALAHYRSGCGLPALSVNWGQWGQVGKLERIGVKMI